MSPLSAASMRSFSCASAASARLISAFEAVPWPERSPFPPAVESAVWLRRSLVRSAADELFVLRAARTSAPAGACRGVWEAARTGAQPSMLPTLARTRALKPEGGRSRRGNKQDEVRHGHDAQASDGAGPEPPLSARCPTASPLGNGRSEHTRARTRRGYREGHVELWRANAISPAWSGGPRAAPRGRRRPGSSRPGRDARRRARRSRRPARGPGQTSRPPWPPAPPPPRPR